MAPSPIGYAVERLLMPLRGKIRGGCFFSSNYGASDEARTRYLHLGKVALYQMSYTRIWAPPQG